MIKVGNVLRSKTSGKYYVVSGHTGTFTNLIGYDGEYQAISDEDCNSLMYDIYDSILDVLPVPVAPESHLDTQHGGDHYKKLGDYQPWQVLKAWLTPEEFRGYMKGTAITYLARERDKGGVLDIKKATHTLQGFIEMEVGE
jgi:hypothetical protein